MMRLAFVSLASFLLPTLSRRSLALDRRGETTLGGGATRGSLGGTRGIPSAQTPATFALLAPREHRLEPRHRGRIFLRADLIETRLETRGTSRPRGALEGSSARTDTEFQSVRGDAPQDDCCAGAQPNEREPAVISPVRPPHSPNVSLNSLLLSGRKRSTRDNAWIRSRGGNFEAEGREEEEVIRRIMMFSAPENF